MATLYRKYRPQTFGEVVGQNHIKLTLEYEVKGGHLAHAYLFCGPRAVGKTTLARIMAKTINCRNRQPGEAEPCNQCDACRDITEGRSLDVIEIDAASNTGVDNVRDNIIAGARLASASLKYKVFIIDEVHMLSGQAFNALLKIMEEPPESVVFILATTEVHKIPATVISRCQRFDFKRISVLDIVSKLEYIITAEGIRADKDVLESIARFSGGHMRDAESALGQIVALADRPDNDTFLAITAKQAELVIPKNDLAQAIKLIDLLVKRDAANALRLIALMADDGFDLKVFLRDVAEMLRQVMLTKINPELIPALGVEIGEGPTGELLSATEKASVNWVWKALTIINKARLDIKESSLGRLPIEMATVEIIEATAPPAASPVNEPTRAVATTDATAVHDLNEILVNWSEFVNSLKKYNHSLVFTLTQSRPLSIQGDTLKIGFRHKLHRDKAAEATMKQTIEKALQEVYGRVLIFEAVLEEGGDAAPVEDTNFDDILKNFGGRIVS